MSAPTETSSSAVPALAASPKNRRVRGPIAVVVFVVLTALGVTGAWLVLRSHPTPTDIVDVVNLDGEYAVLVRDVRGPDARSFLSLFERERGERWGALIPPYAARAAGARSAVAATGEVVMVRAVANGQDSFLVYGAARGQKLGRFEPFVKTRPATDRGHALERAGSLFDHGQIFELSGQPGQWATIHAFDVQSGTILWQGDLTPQPLERLWLRPAHLVMQQSAPDQVVLLERSTGALVERWATDGPPCALADALLVRADQTVREVPFDNPERARTIAALGGEQLVGSCGQTAAHTLVAVDGPRGSAVVALDQARAVAWRLELGAVITLDEVALTTPDRAPLSGQLTRFVPVVTGQGDQLVMIDTEQGRVAWRTARESPPGRGGRLMTVDGSHYWYAPESRILAVFDGATGRLSAARALGEGSSVWPRNIAGGRVWVSAGPRWVVLDAATLAPVPSAGTADTGRDVRAELELTIEVPGARGAPDGD